MQIWYYPPPLKRHPAAGPELPTVAVIRENILRGFRYDGTWLWGGQTIAGAQLPASSWVASANECDVPVDLAGGGTEPQFRAGGEIRFDTAPADVLDELNKADNGRLAEIGGVYKTRSGAPGAAVFSFTDADILSSEAQTFDPFANLATQVNHVTARYLSPAEGWNLSLPAAISAAEMNWPLVTLTPFRVNFPAVGRLLMRTACNWLAGESYGSVKPKSAFVKTYAEPSTVVTVLSVPAGASLTGMTLTVIALATGSRSTPPLAVPPSSCTWNRIEA